MRGKDSGPLRGKVNTSLEIGAAAQASETEVIWKEFSSERDGGTNADRERGWARGSVGGWTKGKKNT